MATSIDELKSQLNELDYNFVEHDESTLVLDFKTKTYRDPDGDPMVTLVIQLSEEGEHFRIFAPKAFNVEGPKKDVYLRAFMDIQSNTSFLRFGYDDEDGEVRPMIDFAIEDAELTQLQLRKCIGVTMELMEQSYQMFHAALP